MSPCRNVSGWTGPLAVLLAAVVVAGCTSTATPSVALGQSGPIPVGAGDITCAVATTEAPAGTISFTVNNTGSKVTKFYLYAAGDRILGEVENVGPGTTRSFTTEVAQGGTYTMPATRHGRSATGYGHRSPSPATPPRATRPSPPRSRATSATRSPGSTPR